MTDEVVTRLYRALVKELRRRGHPAEQPVKVSEIYRELVPYQTVRSTLGVELNADYEHALLRLLAGERDLLRLAPAEAREELRKEVEAPYPFVGLFRKFSASDVWVEMPADYEVDDVEAGGEHSAAADRPPLRLTVDRASRPAARGSVAAERLPVQLHAESSVQRPDRVERRGQAEPVCTFCGADLPEDRRVRFCPHCGGDQRLRPCPRCEAVLERDWQYCISCGQKALD